VAFASLTSPLLGEKRLKPGDEVISVAAGFPTTVNPIIQHGMVPVFVDVEIGTYNVDVAELEKAIGPKTGGSKSIRAVACDRRAPRRALPGR